MNKLKNGGVMSEFKRWLQSSRIKNMDTVKGDFARDIVADRNFPIEDDKSKIFEYIEKQLHKNGTYEAFGEFKSLYSYFIRTIKK